MKIQQKKYQNSDTQNVSLLPSTRDAVGGGDLPSLCLGKGKGGRSYSAPVITKRCEKETLWEMGNARECFINYPLSDFIVSGERGHSQIQRKRCVPCPTSFS